MTNIQKQLRLNALLEAMKIQRKNRISNLDGDSSINFSRTVREEISKLDPMSEQDLISRALITKNLLVVFEINSKYGGLIESEDFSRLRNNLLTALEDESIKNSDNEIAKEIQNGNMVYAYSQKRHSNYTFDGSENFDLNSEVLDIINDTIENDTFNQELDAEDLVNSI